jgi:hypothetical protein
MNGEEKKQNSISGIPSQKQKNNRTYYQQFNFHHFAFVSHCYYLIPKIMTPPKAVAKIGFWAKRHF